jgi:hypothetical protein
VTPAEAEIAAAPQAELLTADAASSPLPMRKPEALRALRVLAQAQQPKPHTERRGSYRYYNYRSHNISRHQVR